MPGIDILIGFAGAMGMIFLSKVVMNKLLRRNSDYYEDRKDGRVKAEEEQSND